MDYMINPILCTVWCSKAAMNIAPDVPYFLWAIFFAVLFTSMNLRGIRASARTNEILVVGMSIVVLGYLISALRYILGMPDLNAAALTRPFYDPQNFSIAALSTGTSIAVLTYIGFDGISTLSEEVKNPRRNILYATVLTCLITGILASIQVYLAQVVWPDFSSYPDVDTAFVHVAGRVGGPVLLQIVNATLLVASIGSGSGAQLGAARLLFGMGRDNTLPRRFFAAVDGKGVPRNNVLFTGAVALIGAFLLSYQLAAELLNFGAFIAFMGVNAAAFVHYFVRQNEKKLIHLIPPVAGFTICLYIWLSLRTPAKIAGGIWLLVGIIYTAWKTNFFRRAIVFSEPPPE